MDPLVDVVAVEVIGDHRLRLSFEDGTVGDVTFDQREWRGVFDPWRPRVLRPGARHSRGRHDRLAQRRGMAPEPLYAEARLRGVTQRTRG
jgi:hypothetical protein